MPACRALNVPFGTGQRNAKGENQSSKRCDLVRRPTLKILRSSVQRIIAEWERNQEESAREQIIIATWPEGDIPNLNDKISLLTEFSETETAQLLNVNIRATENNRRRTFGDQFKTQVK